MELIELPIHLFGEAFALSLLIAAALFLALNIIKRYSREDHLFFDVVRKTHPLFIIILSLYFGFLILTIKHLWFYRIFICALGIQGGFWLSEVVFYALKRSQILGLDRETIASGSIAAINFVTKGVIWSLVIVFLLSNLGFNVTALLTGLGVGGIAIALAVQNVLGDLFASLSIVVDKPFKIGDFVIIDDHKGFIENIGLKTTRIRSIDGEQLIFSNLDLLKSRIRNFKRMQRRRAAFLVGFKMTTPIAQLKTIADLFRGIIDEIEEVTFERTHFKKLGDSSYDFEVVYFLEKPDMGFYLDVQQEINFKMVERFEKEGLELAFPTQTVILEKSWD